MYALILIDEYDTPYNSALTFTDKALWDWLHQPLTFPPGQSEILVPVPAGYVMDDSSMVARVTSGSATNDLAQAVAGIIKEGADACTDLKFETNAQDEDEGGDGGDQWVKDAKAALARINVLPENIYEGLWY